MEQRVHRQASWERRAAPALGPRPPWPLSHRGGKWKAEKSTVPWKHLSFLCPGIRCRGGPQGLDLSPFVPRPPAFTLPGLVCPCQAPCRKGGGWVGVWGRQNKAPCAGRFKTTQTDSLTVPASWRADIQNSGALGAGSFWRLRGRGVLQGLLASVGHSSLWCPLACGCIVTQCDLSCSPLLRVSGFSPCLFPSGFRAHPEFRIIPSPPLPKLLLQRPFF